MSPHFPLVKSVLMIAVGVGLTLASPLADAAPQGGRFDRPRKPATNQPSLNDLSMEVEALLTLHRFQVTKEQMDMLRRWASETAQKSVKRKAPRATAEYRRALQDLHTALVQSEEDERIAELENRLDDSADDSDPELDDDVEITPAARRRAPEALALLTKEQVARFLDLHEDTPEPKKALQRALDRAGNLDDAEWKELSDELTSDLSEQFGGVDLDKARSAGARVASWLRTIRGLSERERRDKRAELEKEIGEWVDSVPATTIQANVTAQALACELLSNPGWAALNAFQALVSIFSQAAQPHQAGTPLAMICDLCYSQDSLTRGRYADRTQLRFAVLALQAGVINTAQFVDACTRWNEAPSRSLADVLVERAGLKPADIDRVKQLLIGDNRDTPSDAPTQIVASHPTGPNLDANGSAVVTLPSEERYARLHIHASGGMGQVWLARDGQLNRNVALKELRAEVAGDGPLTQRFVQEAQITGQLEHPGIVPVYDLGWHPETHEPFYTMRFVRGRTMVDASVAYHEKRLKGQDDPLELVTLLNAFVAVCNTIAYAHSHRILHRDLKGENVLLGDFGEVVVVLDWGLAKALDTAEQTIAGMIEPGRGLEGTIAGSIIGTPGYMAPEQAQARLDLIDERTDIYGLGAILYEILTGQPPSTGDTAMEAIQQALRGDFVPPRNIWVEVPPALEAVCLRALAREQGKRFQTALELGQEVERWQDVQRRAAENALQRQTEILQSILHSMGEGVIVTDAAGRILHINPAAERIFGSHPVGSELYLSRGYEIYLPDQVTPCPADQLPLIRAIGGEEVDDVEHCPRAESAEGLWASVARPLMDSRGSFCGGLVVLRDISERKRAEEELRKSRERFDLAVQGSQDGLWDWDLQTNDIYYSPRWKSIIGYEDHELSPRLEEWESRLHPDEKERVLAANFAHIDGTTAHYEYEYRLRHKDGSYRWILARGAALRDANGRPIAWPDRTSMLPAAARQSRR